MKTLLEPWWTILVEDTFLEELVFTQKSTMGKLCALSAYFAQFMKLLTLTENVIKCKI